MIDMKHDRDTYPYQGKSDRQVKFSYDATHYLAWSSLVIVAIYYTIKDFLHHACSQSMMCIYRSQAW